MHVLNTAATILGVATTLLSTCHAQAPKGTPYTDPDTNTTFSTWEIPGPLGLTFGVSLPASAREVDATDFTGYLKCTTATGWCGISLGGAMTNSLLLVAYAAATADPPSPSPPAGDTSESANSVAISPRYTSTYRPPGPYTGNATITPLSTHVSKEEDTFEIIYTCDSCLHWSQDGSEGGAKTSSGMIDLAWAVSPVRPVLEEDGQGLVSIVQHARQGTWVAEVD